MSTFQLSHQPVPGGVVVRVRGKFDREAGAAVEAVLRDHEGVRVVHLGAVEYLSSTGVAMLAKLSASLGLRIAAPAECVRHTLSLAGVERILAIYEDEEAARGHV